jgi:hypothetical protein
MRSLNFTLVIVWSRDQLVKTKISKIRLPNAVTPLTTAALKKEKNKPG